MKRWFYLPFFMLWLIPQMLDAQNGKEFTASAPEVVYLDTPFQLIYTVNSAAKDLQVPDFNAFEILAGPYESRSSYTQIVNGKKTSSTTISYTFTLMPGKTGNFRVPPASIVAGGEKLKSNELTIRVVTSDESSQNQNPALGRSSSQGQERVTNESIFIRTILSKSNVFEQEAITVTYKLYTLVDVAQFTDVRLPDFTGFLKQDIEQSQNKQLSAETFNGRNYGTVVLYQAILFPQHPGELEIEKASFTALLRLQNKAQVRSIFDDFFDTYTNVERRLVAPAVKVKVKDLPSEGRPKSFSGAVGNFNLTSKLSSGNLKTDEAATIQVVISGSGNMKLLKNPDIKFPGSIEVYDPKVDNEFNTGQNNVSGTKTIEYMFIPRRPGKYEIPSAELSYFDLTNNTYRTLRTPPFRLNVTKGEGGTTVVEDYTGKTDVKTLAKDLRYIYTSPLQLKNEVRPFFGTQFFWLLFALPLVITAILFVFLTKQRRESADEKLMRTKRANRVALKRLRNAEKFLKENKNEEFYRELMKTTWDYISDKLSIPVADLSKENIRSNMLDSGVESELIDKFEDILNRCEYAAYAPGGQSEMGDIYRESIDAITGVEEQLKKG